MPPLHVSVIRVLTPGLKSEFREKKNNLNLASCLELFCNYSTLPYVVMFTLPAHL